MPSRMESATAIRCNRSARADLILCRRHHYFKDLATVLQGLFNGVHKGSAKISSSPQNAYTPKLKSCMPTRRPLEKKRAVKKVDTSPPVATRIPGPPPIYPPPNTSTWITRIEAADLLACAQGTLLN